MKALKYLGLAALAAGISCSSGSRRQCLDENNVCSINAAEYCSPAQRMYAESESVEELTPESFGKAVLENKLPAAVKFYAEWCGPCRAFKPVFEKVCKEYEGRLFCGAYNIDQDSQSSEGISARYDVDRIPSMRFFCSGKEAVERRITGGRPDAVLRGMFDEFLKECGH